MPRNLFEGKPNEWFSSLGFVRSGTTSPSLDFSNINLPDEKKQEIMFDPNWKMPLTIQQRMNQAVGQPPLWLKNAGDSVFSGMQAGANIVKKPMEELSFLMNK